MTFPITLMPGGLIVPDLDLDYPESGAVGTGRMVVAGDQRALASLTGLTVQLAGRTYGPFRGLGDYDYDPTTHRTTLFVAEQLPEKITVAGLTDGTVASVLTQLFPGIDLSALPEPLAGAQAPGARFNGQERRAVFDALIGGLGFRLIQEQGTFRVAAPARADQFGPVFRGGQERGDLSSAPRTIVIKGGTVSVFGSAASGAGGPTPSAQLSGSAATLTWRDPIGETLGSVVAWVVQHSTDGSTYEDRDTVRAAGLSSYTYTDPGLAAGTHYYRLVPVTVTRYVGATAHRRGAPGPAMNVRTDGTPGVVGVTAGVTTFTLTLPGDAPALTVKVTSGGQTASLAVPTPKAVTVGTGRDLALAIAPGSQSTVAFLRSDQTAAYPPLTVTTRAFVDPDAHVLAGDRSAFVTWRDAGRFILDLKTSGGASVWRGTVQGGEANLTGLTPNTDYTLTLAYDDGALPAGQELSFKTLDDEGVVLSEEEIWALSRAGTRTTVTAIAGGTETITRTRANNQLVRTDVRRVATIPTTTTDAETGAQVTADAQAITESTTLHEYGYLQWPDVETRNTTVTKSTTPQGSTTSHVSVRKDWNAFGWVNEKVTDTDTWETPAGGTTRHVLRETETESWTRSGVSSWMKVQSRSGRRTAPVFAADGSIERWVELPISEVKPTANASAPERAPTPRDLSAPPTLGPLEPQGPAAWDQPASTEPLPITDETHVDDGEAQIELSVTRPGSGYGDAREVNLDWSTVMTVLQWAADWMADHFGGLQRTVTREYRYPYGAVRGGAVQGVRLKVTAGTRATPGSYAETVTTKWAP